MKVVPLPPICEGLLNLTMDVAALNAPELFQSPPMVKRIAPPLSVAPGLMVRSSASVQLAEGVMPAALRLAMVTKSSVGALPKRVVAPVPPNVTVPELVKAVPRRLNVTVFVGLKFTVPLLVNVPELVKLPLNVCAAAPPLNVELAVTLKFPATFQPADGARPAVLARVTF